MAAIIEERDVYIPADAWAAFVPPPAHGEDIPALVDAYLARGGKITELEPGARTDTEELDNFTRKIVRTSKFSMAEHAEHSAKSRRRASAKAQARDEELAARILLLLDEPITRKELTRAMGVSDGLVGRILSMYFRDHPHGATLINPRLQQEKEAWAKIREAIDSGMVGLNTLTKHCQVCRRTLQRLCKQHGIEVPLATRGRKGADQ